MFRLGRLPEDGELVGGVLGHAVAGLADFEVEHRVFLKERLGLELGLDFLAAVEQAGFLAYLLADALAVGIGYFFDCA